MQIASNLKALFTSKAFYKNLLFIALFWLVVLAGIYFWLKSYTNHGQSLTLPDYVGQNMEEAVEDAKDRTFDIVVVDSIHIVGKEGGIILNQNPLPAMKVKENRKIYVTTTKYSADKIPLSRFPTLYGKNYDRKSKELKNAFEIESVVLKKQYDPGPSNHILAVIYKGDTLITDSKRKDNIQIPKGATLGFVISIQSGGELKIPDLTCKTYEEAKFYLEAIGLYVSAEFLNSDVTNTNSAYVFRQNPGVDSAPGITRGSGIQLYLSQKRPSNCPVEEGEEEFDESEEQEN